MTDYPPTVKYISGGLRKDEYWFIAFSSSFFFTDLRKLMILSKRSSAMEFKTIVGPLGGKGGDSWDDGINTGIRQIIIVYGTVIDSIHIEYNRDGQSAWGVKHGGPGGHKTAKVELDFPDEHLTLVSGCYTKYKNIEVIHSLTFQSNKRTFGPFGTEKGHRFTVPTSNGKIVGFHGRSDLLLDSIGAHVQPITNPNPIQSIGPFGGQGGDKWDDGIYTGIRQIMLRFGLVIDTISIGYDKDGELVWSVNHGYSSGGKLEMVEFDYPDEFLVSMFGYHGIYKGMNVLKSIAFQTNKKTYGLFGPEGENYFSISVPSTGGKFVGFYGKGAQFIDSIGAHIESIPISYYLESVGPFGGQGGNLWDDGVYSTVRQIIIAAGTIIDSIYIEYDKDGRSIWSPKHGESNGGEKHTVKLDYPDEFLILISGCYGTYKGKTIIQSLTFQTNKTIYGPFGTERGSEFSIISNGGKIVGFYGRSGSFIDSFGAHVEKISDS